MEQILLEDDFLQLSASEIDAQRQLFFALKEIADRFCRESTFYNIPFEGNSKSIVC